MNMPWSDRPTEVANLLNPAFCGAAMHMAVSGFYKEAKKGMPFELAILVLPFALHEATRSRLPRAVSTMLHTWIQEHRDVIIGFAERTKSLVPFTKDAIIFTGQRNVLKIDDNGLLCPGSEALNKVASYKKVSAKIQLTLSKSEFVGRWFALSGTSMTILTLLGVRP